MSKYIFITGGVVSGLGKGITAASLGMLLKSRGYKVNIQRFDPYFNVDSSFLSPYQHGEVFVSEDGGEGDLVIGHYERFLDQDFSQDCEITSGKIYSSVIANERKGGYDGHTVQVVPHITDQIKQRIYQFKSDDDNHIIISEIGGTVGDIECHPFLEAIRQCRSEVGKSNIAYIHVTMLPYIHMSGEQKTKPTQNSVKELQNLGIQPDVIVCRSDFALDQSSKQKLSLFCNVSQNCIIESITTGNKFEIPIKLDREGFADVVLSKLKMPNTTISLNDWADFANKAALLKTNGKKIKLALVGKYVDKPEAYQSLLEALKTGGIHLDTDVIIDFVSSESINEKSVSILKDYNGVIIPSGFGIRGFEGKICAAGYCRKNNIPTLMIGMGAQAALIGFARENGFEGADSQEFNNNCKHPIICNCSNSDFKRGANVSKIKSGTMLNKIYKSDSIKERHRHRFEFNPDYVEKLEQKGLVFSAFSQDGIPDAFELPKCKFFIGVIFHPEFKARPLKPHPLFEAFLTTASTK